MNNLEYYSPPRLERASLARATAPCHTLHPYPHAPQAHTDSTRRLSSGRPLWGFLILINFLSHIAVFSKEGRMLANPLMVPQTMRLVTITSLVVAAGLLFQQQWLPRALAVQSRSHWWS